MAFPRTVASRLLDIDGETLVGSLSAAFGITFKDEQSGCGFGSVNVPLSEAIAAEVTAGRYIEIMTGGNVAFLFEIEGNPEYHQIDEGEEVQQYLTASGRGAAKMFENFIVLQETTEFAFDTADRTFSFASFFFPEENAAFIAATELYEYNEALTSGTGRIWPVKNEGEDPDDPADDVTELYPAPIGFPWPNAPKNGNGAEPTPTYDPTYWIWPTGAEEGDEGYAFFRGTFELAGDQQVSFFVTGDNLYTLYLQGVPILGEADNVLAWSEWKEVTLQLPAGLYVVGAVVQNVPAPELDFNPGGFLFNAIATSIYPGDVETSLTLSLLNSSAAGFDGFFSFDVWPGWTPGQIVIHLLGEADRVDRGSTSCLPALGGITFTDFEDSEGGSWDTSDSETLSEYIPQFSVRIGQTLLDVLEQLEDEGWVDWHLDPQTRELSMWAQGTSGASTEIEFHPPTDPDDATTGNIVGLERGSTKVYANALYVQWDKGYVWVEDTVAIAAREARVEDMFQTDAATVEEAEMLGRIELARRVVDARAAVLMSIEPISADDCPYESFFVGDYVTIPTVDGEGTEELQVLSIECTQDDLGFAQWKLELNRRWFSPQRNAVDLLRSIGGKSIGSPSNHGVPKD